MIVSWNWLKDYVALDVPATEVERRLMMAGLNHESTQPVGDDLAIDLEITSNRPDCLGHLGIAREIAVLFERRLQLPPAAPEESKSAVASLIQVSLECPRHCYRYTVRVVRGVKVGPSPTWLARRLATIGIATINNVVDVTNYVLMECGQPLHAFDLARLAGRRIVVREGREGETLLAIDHKTYPTGAGVCVIADAEQPVGIGGVMGGAETEVTQATTELLIESAEFAPLSIRNTARRLGLHSDSSYRFERGLDPEGVDWASRRASELILDLAGGELAAGVIDVGRPPPRREPIVLRLAQLPRILGIHVAAGEVRRILEALGNAVRAADERQVEVVPPSWRRDLTREIDLIEEVARIHGYDAIPEDVSVPMSPSAERKQDRVLGRVRQALTALGYDEALTLSAVEEGWSAAFSPWTDAPPLISPTPILRRADRLRRSLVPSLLGVRRTNESVANPTIELFEIANVYLPRPDSLPDEQVMLALTSGGDFFAVKGAIEATLGALAVPAGLEVRDFKHPLLSSGRAVELWLAGARLAIVGELSAAGRKEFELRGTATVAELRLAPLVDLAGLVPRYREVPATPAISRDLNLEIKETVRWSDVASTVREAAGSVLEQLAFKDIYRNDELVRQGEKRLLFSVTLRDPQATLTGAQADAIRERIVAACSQRFGARLQAS
ncbi:MAG TPA: phenylalanine--tRNA ligase subunit beta [Pirellulales bacterium]|nr:phenylalanine--tRNA ligase subunit beta [Pirellulales bacterium]